MIAIENKGGYKLLNGVGLIYLFIRRKDDGKESDWFGMAEDDYRMKLVGSRREGEQECGIF